MALTPAERMRRSRDRERRGRRIYHLEVDAELVVGRLVDEGMIADRDADSDGAVATALGRVLERWARNENALRVTARRPDLAYDHGGTHGGHTIAPPHRRPAR